MNPKRALFLFAFSVSGILYSQSPSLLSNASGYQEKAFELRSPKNGDAIRKNLRLELAGEWAFPLRGLLVLSNQNRVFFRTFEIRDAETSPVFPVRDFASETYELKVSLVDDSNRTVWVDRVENIRILRNVSIFLLGSRPASLYGADEQRDQDRSFGALLQLLTRESRVSSLNIEGAYGRFGTARAIREILRRAPASDLNLFYVDMAWSQNGGFLSQDYNPEKKETVIVADDILPCASNSFFLFHFPKGPVPENPLFTTLSYSAHSNSVISNLEDFYRNARGAEPLVKPWNTLSDLKDFQKETALASRLDEGLASSLLRAYRWVPGQIRSNVSSVPVYTTVTNDSRPVLVTRNFVTYQALRTGAISKIQTDLRVDVDVKTTPGHWEE